MLVCFSLSCTNATKDAIAEAEQRIRDAGQPVTLDELNAYYAEAPVAQNAAFVYREAFDQFESVDREGARAATLLDRVSSLEGKPIPADLQADVRAHVTACAKVFATLDRAATLPKARYSLDLRDGADTELPHLAKLRSCARLESLRSALAVSEGRPADLVKSQKSLLRMADSLSGEPLLISQLVRIAIHGIGSTALEHAVSVAAIPPEHLLALQKAYEDAEDPDCMIHAYIGERCAMLDMLGRFARDGADSTVPESVQMLEGLQNSGIDFSDEAALDRQRLLIVKHFEPLTQSANLSWPARVQLLSEVEAAIEADTASDPSLQVLVPSLVRAVEAFGRDIAILRNSQAALAVERFRADTGELPDDLSQLVPKYLDAPIEDPFDGQPLRYNSLAKGYQVYSVYADLKDDGGRLAVRTDSGFKGDWPFEVRR